MKSPEWSGGDFETFLKIFNLFIANFTKHPYHMIPALHTLETLKEQRKIGIYRLHQQLIEEKFLFYESNKTLFLSFFIFMIALLVEKV